MTQDTHRYTLFRNGDPQGKKNFLVWVMLNPSKSVQDASTPDDNTTQRIIDLTKELGHRKLGVLNLFPVYATDSPELSGMLKNELGYNRICQRLATKCLIWRADKVIIAWGSSIKNVTENDRKQAVKNILTECQRYTKHQSIYCLKRTTKPTYYPFHPLLYHASYYHESPPLIELSTSKLLENTGVKSGRVFCKDIV